MHQTYTSEIEMRFIMTTDSIISNLNNLSIEDLFLWDDCLDLLEGLLPYSWSDWSLLRSNVIDEWSRVNLRYEAKHSKGEECADWRICTRSYLLLIRYSAGLNVSVAASRTTARCNWKKERGEFEWSSLVWLTSFTRGDASALISSMSAWLTTSWNMKMAGRSSNCSSFTGCKIRYGWLLWR